MDIIKKYLSACCRMIDDNSEYGNIFTKNAYSLILKQASFVNNPSNYSLCRE